MVQQEESLRELTAHAVTQGSAGADIVVSLGRLDNAVSSMRAGLDAAQLHNVAILAYSINFGSSLAHAMLDGTDMAANSYAQTIASKIGVGILMKRYDKLQSKLLRALTLLELSQPQFLWMQLRE